MKFKNHDFSVNLLDAWGHCVMSCCGRLVMLACSPAFINVRIFCFTVLCKVMFGIKFALHSSVFLLRLSVYQFVSNSFSWSVYVPDKKAIYYK